MQFDLVSGSERDAHALFDPAVIEPLRSDASEAEWDVWLDRQITTGRMLYYFLAGDEELRLKLLVDEPFETPGPYGKSGAVEGAIVRVVSGRLCLTGVEAVHEGEADVAQANVAAGVYRVTAFRADHRLTRARINQEIAHQIEPGDARYVQWAERVAIPAGCGLILAAIVAAFVFLFSHVTWWFPAATGSAGVALAAGFLVWRLYSSPRLGRWHQAADALWKRYPPVVVVLRRLTDNEVPDTFAPGRFGGALTKSS